LAVIPAILTSKHVVRDLLAACILICLGTLTPVISPAAESTAGILALDANPTVAEVTRGSLDSRFSPFAGAKLRGGGAYWLKLKSANPADRWSTPLRSHHGGQRRDRGRELCQLDA
jgi:hypothetical protein